VGEGEGVRVSEFVWGVRKARVASRVRSRPRELPTPTAPRAPNTLPLTGTLGRLALAHQLGRHVRRPDKIPFDRMLIAQAQAENLPLARRIW